LLKEEHRTITTRPEARPRTPCFIFHIFRGSHCQKLNGYNGTWTLSKPKMGMDLAMDWKGLMPECFEKRRTFRHSRQAGTCLSFDVRMTRGS
jgi:hypothetical protein